MTAAHAKGVQVSDDGTSGAAAECRAVELSAADPVLTEREQAMLEFERQWWKFAGSKEEAVKERFEMSGTRYYQILNSLIDRPEALAADPMLVKRLRRMRDSRRKARAARSLGMRST